MLKTYLLIIISNLLILWTQAQTLTNPPAGDSLYPVTSTIQFDYPSSTISARPPTIYGIFKDSGKYYLSGNFENLTENSGSTLLYDTITKIILNNRVWRINGQVITMVPDGKGGYFIGGTFTAIGDSSRRYIAQINSTGRPTAWNPGSDSIVNCILKRNDTLFIGGAFKKFAGVARNCFAMHSAVTHTLFANGGGGIFSYMSVINTMLLHKDTLIYGGTASGLAGDYNHLRKYCFKNNFFLAFTLSGEHREIQDLNFSADSSLLIFRFHGAYDAIRAVDNRNAALRYRFYTYSSITTSDYGTIYDLEIAGNKGYIAGDIWGTNPGGYYRRGVIAFNALTGEQLSDNLNLDHYATSVQHINGKLYISGKFKNVNATPRYHFAVVDTGTYAVRSLELTPSDPFSSISFQNNIALITGFMSGLNAIKRDGLAVIDSATHNLTPFNTPYPAASPNVYNNTTLRMMKRGDSLFLLVASDRYNECRIEFASKFKIYSVATGLEYGINAAPAEGVNDILIDGNYMYVSYNSSIRRYSLPQLILDNNWGYSWVGNVNTYEHSLNHLMSDSTKIYAVGDNKYYTGCGSSAYIRRAYFDVYSKSSGAVINSYRFEGVNQYYDMPKFHRGVIAGNKIYIQGRFTQLNGVLRKNFVALNINTGAITNWNPNIPTNDQYSFNHTSVLKLHNGKIWFGAQTQYLADSSLFGGFGGIDTATGLLSQPVHTSLFNRYNTVEDFILSDSELVLAGSFDSINGRPFVDFAVLHFNGINKASGCSGARTISSNLSGNSYQWQMDSGAGFVNLSDNATFSGTQTANLQLNNVPTSWYGYKFRAVVNGNAYSETFLLRFSSTWLGSLNTDWSNALNWNCGAVPDQYTDVIISNGTVIVNANPVIRSLTVAPTASFKVLSGKNLTVLE